MQYIKLILVIILIRPLYSNSQSYFEESSKIAFDIYKENISNIKSNISNCQFYPSCSEYSKQSIEQYGIFPGIILTADRLIRCSGGHLNRSLYPKYNNKLLLDLPENNFIFNDGNLWNLSIYSKSNSEINLSEKDTSEKVKQNVIDNSIFGFSKYLFKKNFNQYSIIELERIIFNNFENKEIINKSNLIIGLNYLQLNKVENSRDYFDNVNSLIKNLEKDKNILLLITGELEKTFLWNDNFLDKIIQQSDSNDNAVYLKFKLYNNIRLGNLNSDSLYLFKGNENLSSISREINTSYSEIKIKSPIIAGLLSTLLPGSGYIYSGEIKEGMSALVVNSLLGIGIYSLFKNNNIGSGILTSLVTVPFYLGNIVGSINAAYLYNNKKQEMYFHQLRYKLGIDYYFSINYFYDILDRI